MDMNEYVLGQLVRSRLEEMRAEAWRQHLAADAVAARGSLRVRIGTAVIKLGTLVLGAGQRGPDTLASRTP